jgi:hypothetical protein
MKRLSILVLMLVVVALLMGCQSFSSADPTQAPPPPASSSQPAATKPAGTGPTIPPAAGKCQSRLWGKVTAATGGAIKPNTTIDIASGTFKAKTQTDANGLYGFAGLCSGDYTLSATPQGGAAQAWPNKIPVDGANEVKLDVPVK